MKTVCTLLGLSADASEEAAHTAVTTLLNRAKVAEDKVTPLTNRVTELETANTTLVDEQIAADLDAKGIKDEKIRNKFIPVLKKMTNRTERKAFLDECVTQPTTQSNAQTKLLNRNTTPPNGAKADKENNGQADNANAVKIMNRARVLQKDMPTLSLATAVKMAQDEVAAE